MDTLIKHLGEMLIVHKDKFEISRTLANKMYHKGWIHAIEDQLSFLKTALLQERTKHL